MSQRYATYIGATIVFAGLAPTTWIIDPVLGYLLSAVMLCAICWMGLASVREYGQLSIFLPNKTVLGLLGLYWVGLIVQLSLTADLSIVPYVVLTPAVILVLFFVASPAIVLQPKHFVKGLVVSVAALTVLGVVLLVVQQLTTANFPWTGNNVFGLPGLRISSVYGNPNALGFATAVASLGALWRLLDSYHWPWGVALSVTFLGLVLSDATMALLAFVIAAGTLFLLRSPLLGVAFAVLSVLLTGVFLVSDIGLSYLTLVIERGGSERIEFWQAAFAHAAENPLIGAGFGHEFPTHNSFVAAVLNLGYVVGGLYILAIAGAVVAAWIKAWNGSSWDQFVVSMLVLLLFQMMTESFTLGGLSTESWVLATFIGLSILETSKIVRVPLPDPLEYIEPNTWRLNR
jgi:hypothetical protein